MIISIVLKRSLALAFAFLTPYSAVAAESPPNVLFILTDDQRADTIGALGNPHVQTPNLDKLARRSLVFPNAYCFGAHTGAVCIASRNMLMTGQTWHRWAPATRCPHGGITFPKVMRKAGYETFYREKSARANHPKILEQFDHFADIHNVNALMSGRACKPFVDDALEFLETTRDESKPFFIYLGVSGPHDPRFSKQRFRDQYDAKSIPLPPNFKPIHHWDIGDMTIRDESLEAWPRDPEATRSHIFDYYALLTAMDFDLGRLLDHLTASGLDENTIIVFSSDHGLALGSHGLFGKQNIYEDGMRVPFFIAGPGIEHGRSDALVYLHDIFPTIADFAGAPVSQPLDGKSLRPVIDGSSKGVRDLLSLAYKNTQRSIRDSRWKLMIFPQINKHQLFDLKNDPHELTDLAGNAEHKQQVDRLTALLRTEQEYYGDKLPLLSESPKPAEFAVPTKAKVKPRRLVGGAVK